MLLTVVFGLLAGFFAGDGLPYYAEGSARRDGNPSPFGKSPVVNVIIGWAAFVVAGVFGWLAQIPSHPVAGGISVAVGVLVVGLIHARVWPRKS
jgi:hypothetical protein